MQIAAIQLATRWEDRPGNHARVAALLSDHRIRPGALVVTPEMFDTGFSMNVGATDPGEPSISEAFCASLARSRSVSLMAGMVRRRGIRFSNDAVFFALDGRIIGRYRKMQPFTPAGEHLHYDAGEGVETFNWDGLRICPLICYDLRFPEHFRAAAAQGAELFAVLANWPKARGDHWTTLLKARAIENQAYVLGVNRCGSDPNAGYGGGSCLFDPLGRQIFQADGDEQVLIAEIDVDLPRRARAAFPALRDRR